MTQGGHSPVSIGRTCAFPNSSPTNFPAVPRACAARRRMLGTVSLAAFTRRARTSVRKRSGRSSTAIRPGVNESGREEGGVLRGGIVSGHNDRGDIDRVCRECVEKWEGVLVFYRQSSYVTNMSHTVILLTLQCTNHTHP